MSKIRSNHRGESENHEYFCEQNVFNMSSSHQELLRKMGLLKEVSSRNRKNHA